MKLITLQMHCIRRGRYQPRYDFPEQSLHELGQSIRAAGGLIQPLVVRPIGTGEYELIAGERRWRAAQMVGLQELPAVVRDIPDHVAAALALVENLHREDLSPIAEARAIARLRDEFGLTQQEIASALGLERAGVAHRLRLLQLHPRVQEWLDNRSLELGHGKVLASLPQQAQYTLAQQAVQRQFSVRQLTAAARAWRSPRAAAQAPDAPDPNIARLESRISETLGARTRLTWHNSGKGELTVCYNSLDELEGILTHMRIPSDTD